MVESYSTYTQGDANAEAVSERVPRRISRLPRRPTQQPSVKELVKKYQEFLPPDGVQELAKTAFAPSTVVSESDPEYAPLPPRATARTKTRHHIPAKKPSVSDFEQGYAANVAPRYLAHSRRNGSHVTHGSRIPGPVGESSLESSRRPSPEKHVNMRTRAEEAVGKHLPQMGPKPGRGTRTRPPLPGNSGKSNFRRPTGGSKVSTITKHFERINRDNEKANRRYVVIRGKRARPVASARAKVEILESIKDAINDESESSDSSEADDEGDGSDKDRRTADKTTPEPSKEDALPEPECAIPLPAPLITPPVIATPPEDAHGPQMTSESPEEAPMTHTSPILPISKPENASPLPPEMELEPGPTNTERLSILKAISGLWPQQPSRNREGFDAEDPMSDPEHIFRDSSMVVRTDEPTSIIALALKYVLVHQTFSSILISLVVLLSIGKCCRNHEPRSALHGNLN